jgi:ribosomal protein S18 acetylase RimI-like enzyme
VSAEPLANAVWHALTGAQGPVAERLGAAARFLPDLSPFAAVADTDDPAAWSDLAKLVGPNGHAALFRAAFTPPTGWVETWGGDGVQMVAGGPLAPPRESPVVEVVELGPADAGAMAELAGATRPGPWLARTHTLGRFAGVRAGGRLVAMAGTRLHLPPYREISAVCTDPDHRRQGLAAALVARVAAAIRADGEVPFLHAAAGNTDAIRLYQAMGFDPVRQVHFGAYRAPSA